MIPVIIVVVILLTGAGTTAVVADNANPGDVLYGVDRAVENIRLSIAGENSKNELKIKFAEERLEEVRELIEEASDNDDLNEEEDGSDDDNATSSDDSSDDDSELDEGEADNIEVGLQHALNLLAELNAEKEGNPGLGNAIDQLINSMNALIVSLPGHVDVRLDSNDLEADESGSVGRFEIKIDVKKDGETKIETRMNGERVRIEIDEDGEMEIRAQEDRRGSNSGEEDRLDSDMRGESRLRVDDDEIESDTDTGGSDDEEDDTDDSTSDDDDDDDDKDDDSDDNSGSDDDE